MNNIQQLDKGLSTDINHTYYGKMRVITNDKGISHWLIKNYIWEEHILNLIFKYIRPDSTIIDIGANMGTHTIGITKHILEKASTKGTKIIAFEPQPFIYSLLQHNMLHYEDPKIEIELHPCGLSNKETTIFMSMPNYEEVENPGGYGLEWNETYTEELTKVEVRTLDSFNLSNVSFIKIDVEGHENQVLNGAQETIRQSKPVMIIEILGGVHIENASDKELMYINETIKNIELLNYSVELISCSDYLCIPL